MAISISMRAAFVLVSLQAVCVWSLETQTQPQEESKTIDRVGAPKVLRLEKQSVVLPKPSPRAGKRKNFYSAKIGVGKPGQEFHVSFDLGGGTVVLPSEDCTSPACLERRRFDRWQSSSAEDIQASGHLVDQTQRKTRLLRRDRGTIGLHSVDVGSGQAKGTFVRDQVCVGKENPLVDDDSQDERCFPLAMLLASSMENMPFALEPYDGTIGLGLQGMSLSSEFNFLAAFHRGYGQPIVQYPNSFGLHIGADEDGGEITLGGYDAKRLTHPLKWTPVAAPEDGRWQVAIRAIRIGNNTLNLCKNQSCRAAIDYSSSLLAVPAGLAPSLEKVLAFESAPDGFGNGCQYMSIPDLQLDLANDVTLTVPAEDFVSDFGGSKGVTLRPSCEPLLSHHQADEPLGKDDMFILGESILRRYYTFFNADTLQVGFSLAVGVDTSGNRNRLAGGDQKDGKNSKKSLTSQSGVILLVQVKLSRSKSLASISL